MRPFSLKDVLEVELPIINILDIGAMRDGHDRYNSLREMGLAKVTGFEPSHEHYENLTRTKNDNENYFPYYLGNGKSSCFYVTRHPGCSSLYKPDPATINLFETIGTEKELNGNFWVQNTENVNTIRLDDIKECPLPDYIKIDVQGAELDILENAQHALRNALIIESEVEFIPIYKDQPLFGDIQVFLRDYNFVLHKMIDVGGRAFRPLMNSRNPFAAISQLLWADAIFCRDFTNLNLYSDQDLIKSALILHQVYFSYDLTLYLLRELDLRNSSKLSARYAEALGESNNLPLLFMNPKEHG